MKKFDFKEDFPSLLALSLVWLAGWYFYQNFPDRVVTHWNFYGNPDAWGKGTTNALVFPGLVTGIYLVFLALPHFDPKKERYQEFRKTYQVFKSLIVWVMCLIFLASGAYNLGYNVPIQYVVPGIIGLLMIGLGNYMGKLKPNWFMGIRTPWTMSSENVWTKTHRMGGYAFIIFGLLLILTPFLPQSLGLVAFGLGLLLAVAGTMGYSYWAYKQEQKHPNL